MKKRLLLLTIFILIAAVFFYWGHCKAGFFIDEIYTYGLSNSHYAPYLSDLNGTLEDQVLTRQQLVDYATVDNGEVFDFGSVYYNQEADVHPPLYYFVFNAASSLAGNSFSKWTGLVLDFVIYCAALFVLYLICKELDFSIFVSAAVLLMYGLSTIGISTALMIRMYVLLTLLTCLLMLCILRLMKTGKPKHVLLAGLVIFLGMMTQYYFVFYACFVSIAVIVYFIAKKKYRIAAGFGLTALSGVLLMVALFPASLKHIFVGNGQVVSAENALGNLKNLSGWIYRLGTYFHYVTHGLKAAVIIGIVAFIFLLVGKRLRISGEITVLVAPAIVSWLVVTLISPVLAERYIYNIMPAFVLLTGWMLSLLNFYWIQLAAVAVIALVFAFQTPEYINPQCLDYNSVLSVYSTAPAVYLTDGYFAPLTYDFQQLLLFDDVFTTNDTASEKMLDYIGNSDRVVVFIDQNGEWSSGYNPDAVLKELEESTGFDKVEVLYTNGFSGTYLLKD